MQLKQNFLLKILSQILSMFPLVDLSNSNSPEIVTKNLKRKSILQ